MKTYGSEAALRRFHLWSGLPDELWQYLKSSMQQRKFAAGELLFSKEHPIAGLCLLLSGRARVYTGTADPSHNALMRTMESGALFGVHAVFSADIPPQSRIVADRPGAMLIIPAEVWERILTEHPPTMAAYVRFLTQRIQFLNRKIQFLTAGSAERRLALFLLSEIPTDDVPVRLDISAVSLADLLDLGRASLYRALTQLSADGFLERYGHEYCLHRRDELMHTYL